MRSKNITIGCTATDFPPLRGSKPAREPGVMPTGVILSNYQLTCCSAAVLLGVSSILGLIGNASAMALSVTAGALGMAFANIDKIKRFKGAGFEAEMVHKMEAIVEKETEPEAESEDTYWYAKTPLDQEEQRVIQALANPAFTWRYVGGLSKESGLSRDKVKSILKSLEDKHFAERSSNEKGEIWTPSRRGRNAAILLAGDLNEA